MNKILFLAVIAAILAGCNNMKQIKPMPYQISERTDVSDNYFGTEVADPYRW
jgi:prolyl oligopeptidase